MNPVNLAQRFMLVHYPPGFHRSVWLRGGRAVVREAGTGQGATGYGAFNSGQ